MTIKGSAIAIFVSAAIAWSGTRAPSVSAWSLSPVTNRIRGSGTTGQSWNYPNSETVLQAAPDAPLFSDDLTGRTNHGPNPRHLTVKYKETMLRQAYDEWRAKYGRGDFDTERFRIFKFNFLASLRAHELQTSRAKIEGRPLPKLLELNAYGDCSKEEYLLLKEQESQNLVAPRTIVDANATVTSTLTSTTNVTANVTATAPGNSTATTPTATPPEPDALPKTPEVTPKKAYSLPVDNRGPERERKATTFPQRSTNLTTALTPLSPMTPKVPPTKSLQQQLDDLSRATNSLAPQPNISRKLPQFSSVGTTSQLPKPSQSFLKPDEKGIIPERSASYFPKRTNPPKLAAAKSDQETKLVTNVNPNPGSSYVPPDQKGIFGEKSATTFPKRTEAHATPKPAPKSDSGPATGTSTSAKDKDILPVEAATKAETNTAPPPPAQEIATDTSSTLPQSTTPPAVALSDQEKRDVTKLEPDATTTKSANVNNPKPKEEAKKATPPTATSAATPVLMPDTKDVPKIRGEPSNARRSFTQNLASTFSKQGQVDQKTGTDNSIQTPPRPSTSVKPDVFYKEQSALSFPKRTEAHQAKKVAPDATSSSETVSTTDPVPSPKSETEGPTGPRSSTNPSGSFIKPDVFFQERSAMTFPKRTEAHKSRLPSTESERKQSPSLSYIKPDFPYPERSVTTFPQRTEAQFALVKAAMFRDDVNTQAPPKTLLPDQRRANIADPFSFAKKKRDDLPPPDFEGQKEPTTTKLENTTTAETSLPVTNTVDSAPVEKPKEEPSDPSMVVPSSEIKVTEPKNIKDKPEVQVSVPDMTDIQRKLAKPQTKEAKASAENVAKPVPATSTPPLQTSTKAKQDQPATDLAPPKTEETKAQQLDDGSKQPIQTQATKKTKEDSKNSSEEEGQDNTSLGAKNALLEERIKTEAHDSQESSIDSLPPSEEKNTPGKPESKVEVTQGKNSSFVKEGDKTGNDSTNMSTPSKQISNSTTTLTIDKDDASVSLVSTKKGANNDKSSKADTKPAASGSAPPQAKPSQVVEKSTSTKSVESESVSIVDPLARQKEIEDALKADFSAPTIKPADTGRSPPQAKQSRTYETSTSNNSNSVESRSAREVDRLARQKEIEEALKAEFSAAASSTDRQKQIEAIFEGKVAVQAKRPTAPVYDPFAVGSSSSGRKPKSPPASVEDVLAEEMNAVKALKTNQPVDPAIKAAEEALKGPRTVSIHDILKAEMDAAKMMKKVSSAADIALSVPISNGSLKNNDTPTSDAADLNTKSKGLTENTIENESNTRNPQGEEMDATKLKEKASSEADIAVSVPLTNGSLKNKDASTKADLNTKSKGNTKNTIKSETVTENATDEEKPQNKKRK